MAVDIEALESIKGRRKRKARLRELLNNGELDSVADWCRRDRNLVRALQSLLFDPDPLTCWRAIEGLGRASAVLAEDDPEKVREIIRRQFWQMNDESGNVGWYAAEAVGDILYNVPDLIGEFAEILPAFFVEEPFERGAHWSVARVASLKPDTYRLLADKIAMSLNSEDPAIRLFTLWILKHLKADSTAGPVRRLAGDSAEVSYYHMEKREFVKTTVGRAAAETLAALQ